MNDEKRKRGRMIFVFIKIIIVVNKTEARKEKKATRRWPYY
jgi:hypothetical protein